MKNDSRPRFASPFSHLAKIPAIPNLRRSTNEDTTDILQSPRSSASFLHKSIQRPVLFKSSIKKQPMGTILNAMQKNEYSKNNKPLKQRKAQNYRDMWSRTSRRFDEGKIFLRKIHQVNLESQLSYQYYS